MVTRAGRKELKRIQHTTIYEALKKEKRMRLRMLRDLEISFDGRNPQSLKQGESYDVPESFVPNLLAKGIAMEDKAIDPPKETKTKKTTRRKPRK